MSGTFTWLTPPGPAALGLVRVVGLPPGALDRDLPAAGRARFARLRDVHGALLDELVVWHLEDGACELSIHGGDGVRALVGAGLASHGLQPKPQAATASARWQALAAAPSVAAAAWIARQGPFPAAPPFAADFLIRPPLVLLTGGVNAGKSTLLNAWCGRERALVSDRPGTTRDLVSAQTLIGGWRVILVDSAGLRAGGDALEQAGQRLVAQARSRADLVIHLDQPGEGHVARDGELVVRGKADLRSGDAPAPAAAASAEPWWSSLGCQGRSSAELLAGLGAALLARLGLPALQGDDSFLLPGVDDGAAPGGSASSR